MIIVITITIFTITTTRCTSEKGRKVGSQKPPGWSEGTLYKCPFCLITYFRWFSSLILLLILSATIIQILILDPDLAFRYFTFRIHLGITHQIKDSEEKKAFIEVNEFLTDIYTCKVG